MTVRVAAIDCGTNSIRLLIADIDPSTRVLTDLVRTMEIVRLGQGVDRTGMLDPQALQRTFAACDSYAAAIAEHQVVHMRFVATSATRDASNRADFVAGVRSRLEVEPEVVTGEQEAALSFAGALNGLDSAARGPFLVVDIGGGSTEFVVGIDFPVAACSVDIGCVRITERLLHDDPPTPGQINEATTMIDAAIARAAEQVPLQQAAMLVGLAGSVTTVAALALGLTAYDPHAIHGSKIGAEVVHRISGELLAANRAERAAYPVMHPGRVDVIGAGALILDRIMIATGASEVLVSEHDILDGIALMLALESTSELDARQ